MKKLIFSGIGKKGQGMNTMMKQLIFIILGIILFILLGVMLFKNWVNLNVK